MSEPQIISGLRQDVMGNVLRNFDKTKPELAKRMRIAWKAGQEGKPCPQFPPLKHTPSRTTWQKEDYSQQESHSTPIIERTDPLWTFVSDSAITSLVGYLADKLCPQRRHTQENTGTIIASIHMSGWRTAAVRSAGTVLMTGAKILRVRPV